MRIVGAGPGRYIHGYLTNLPPESGFPSTLDVTRFSPSYVWTAGAIVSTVDDLARFYRALFTGQLLRPAQLAELEATVPTPIGVSYGLGVYEVATPCGAAWGHDGDVFGYATIALSSLDGSRQVVVSLNSDKILTTQAQVDLGEVLITGFCGGAVTPGRSVSPLPTLDAASLPH